MIGAKLKRIDGPTKESLVLSLERLVGKEDKRTREKTFVRLDLTRGRATKVESRPKGATPDGFVQKLRKELGKGRVTNAEQSERGLVVTVQRGEAIRRLVIDQRYKNAILTDETGAFIHARFGGPLRELKIRGGAPYPFPGPFTPLELHEERETDVARADNARHTLTRTIRRARKKHAKTLAKIEGDLKRADEAPALRDLANRILAALPGVDPTIKLPDGRAPQEHAERLFHRAKRYERGRVMATSRHHSVTETLEEIDALLASLASPEASVDDIRRRALLAGVRDAQRVTKKKKKKTQRAPFRRFLISGGGTALVGRSARDNDELTLRHARPYDLWLHARGVRGSHVIVPLQRGEECRSDVLTDAAILAAHFSSVSGDDSAEVQYVARRHVHKRKGSAPGSVRVDREKTILVLLRREEIARLLGNEIDPFGPIGG